MEAQLAACGLPYRFFDAIQVDLKKGWPDLYNRTRRLNYSGIDLRAGEMGCYLSHRAIWHNFLGGDEPLCLVIEDDVTLSLDFAEVVQSLCDMQQQWEFVRLFGVFNRKVYPSIALACGRTLVDYLQQPNGTQGYLMNRDAVKRLLAHTESMCHAIDNSIDRDWEHGVRLMGIAPSVLSLEENFDTTLGIQTKLRLPWHGKVAREFHRAGSNLRKQLWLYKKARRLRLRSSDNQ